MITPDMRPDPSAAGEETALTPQQQQALARRRRMLMRVLILFLLLDVVAAAVLFGLSARDKSQRTSVRDAQAQKAGVTQQMTAQEKEEQVAIAIGEAHNRVTLRSEMTAEGGVAHIYLGNDEENACAVEVELILLDSRETILRTGVIEPGWYLEDVLLSAPLEPGEYQCLAHCLFYTMDDNAYLGRTARQVLLTVL